MIRLIIAIAALLPAIASAQWHLNFKTQAECVTAGAALLGPAGGSVSCTTTSTRQVTVPPTGVSIAAVCDGLKDNITAIRAAVTEAKAKGLPALVPAGICAYGDTITLDGVRMLGKGDASVLHALNVERAAIFLRGSGAELRSVKLAGVAPTARLNPYEGWRVVAVGASQWVVDNVTITSSTAVGIGSTRASSHGTISNNRVSGTRADAIHLTDQSSHIKVLGNRIDGVGDDGIAVVSYRAQVNPVHHITAVGNVIGNNKGGRSMSVVGGEDVLYENNRMSNSGVGACLYLAQETAYDTLPVKRIIARNNTLTNCGDVSATGHAAVMVFSGGTPNENVTVQRNEIVQGPTQIGIRAFGPQTGIVIDANRIQAGTPLRLPADIVAVPYASGSVGAR